MKLIFTLSTGRTGTAFLSELLAQNLPGAEVHHERLGFDAFGVHTPDLSDMVLFNSRGNVSKVKRFWEQKLERILESKAEIYAETSHVLMKAGLVENAVRICRGHELHFIRLRRAIVPTLLSYERRGDFMNKSSQWLWYLDDAYPRTFVKPEQFRRLGFSGLALWYLLEVEFRAAYYRERYGDEPGVSFHAADLDDLNDPSNATALLSAIRGEPLVERVIIPEKKNVSEAPKPPEEGHRRFLEKIVAATEGLSSESTAREFVGEGVDFFAPDEVDGEKI